jgi:hypothetical protein
MAFRSTIDDRGFSGGFPGFQCPGIRGGNDRLCSSTNGERTLRGRWLDERLAHERSRVHDDGWLFSRFEVYEATLGILE